MKILTNDFSSLWKEIRNESLADIDNFGHKGWYILGNEVSNFEKRLGNYWGKDYLAAGCGNGLDAIELSLKVLNLPKNSIVLTTPLSAFATTLAIIRAGGIPAFVDTDSSGLIDFSLVEQVLDHNPQIKFFVPVHLYGHSLNLNRLAQIKKRRIKIIEDCAQSIGSMFNNKTVGECSDVFITSFYPTKNLGAFGDGGAVLSKNKKLIDQIKSLRNYGQTSKYHHEYLGSNSRLDEIQAVLLTKLLSKLDKFILRRIEIANFYLGGIKNKKIKILEKPEYSYSTYHLFPITVSKQSDFINYLKANGVEANIHYPSLITEQPAMKKTPFFVYGSLNNAHYLTRHEVSLPIHPFLSDDDVKYVIKICNNW